MAIIVGDIHGRLDKAQAFLDYSGPGILRNMKGK